MNNEHIRLSIRSADYPDMNWLLMFSAWAEYRLEGADFIWELALKNEDTQPFPAGFGHHPYFVKTDDVQVQIPCNQYFELTDLLATQAAIPLPPKLDFRQMKAIGTSTIDSVLTGRISNEPARIHYPERHLTLDMRSDWLFEQIILYAPPDKPYFAVEPMSNVNDGFNLYTQGIPGSGVFVLQPGEEKMGRVRLTVRQE